MRNMNINIQQFSPYYSRYTPNFNGKYEVDTSTAISRNQVFTLGMLMNNFWIFDARSTFNRIRYNSVYGKATVNVNVDKEALFERILKMNNIKYTKLDQTV